MKRSVLFLCAGVLSISTLAGCGCDYEDPAGNCISKEDHERRVANDAAVNALANLMAFCSGHPDDAQCAALKRQ